LRALRRIVRLGPASARVRGIIVTIGYLNNTHSRRNSSTICLA
jgi:hypothetical protein